jgi:hypothetical protein
MELAQRLGMVARELHQLFLVLVSLMPVAVVVGAQAEHRLQQAVLAAVVILARQALQTVVVAAAVQMCQVQDKQAAPASSSFPTLWRPALRLSLNPRPHGLPPRARPRWTISLSRVVAVVVGAQAVAVALVVSEREQVCPLRLEPLTL